MYFTGGNNMSARPVQRVQELRSFYVDNKRNRGAHQLFNVDKYTPVGPLKRWLSDKGYTKISVDIEAKLLIEDAPADAIIPAYHGDSSNCATVEEAFREISGKIRVITCPEEGSLIAIANPGHIKTFNKLYDGTLRSLTESSSMKHNKGNKKHHVTLEEIGKQLDKEWRARQRDFLTIEVIEERTIKLRILLKGDHHEVAFKMERFSKGIQSMLFEEGKKLSEDNILSAFNKVKKGVKKDGTIFCLETAILYLEEQSFLKV
jgi:hypothetical protein